VTPLALTARLLMPLWHYGPGEEDLTAMRVVAEGQQDGRRVRRTFELVDRYDRATGTSSMARTTGYTCTAAVRLLASGRWSRPGITPPETIGRDAACCRFILDDLAKRRVVFHERREEL
jgi:lysine 6-dehydrogenase